MLFQSMNGVIGTSAPQTVATNKYAGNRGYRTLTTMYNNRTFASSLGHQSLSLTASKIGSKQRIFSSRNAQQDKSLKMMAAASPQENSENFFISMGEKMNGGIDLVGSQANYMDNQKSSYLNLTTDTGSSIQYENASTQNLMKFQQIQNLQPQNNNNIFK